MSTPAAKTVRDLEAEIGRLRAQLEDDADGWLETAGPRAPRRRLRRIRRVDAAATTRRFGVVAPVSLLHALVP